MAPGRTRRRRCGGRAACTGRAAGTGAGARFDRARLRAGAGEAAGAGNGFTPRDRPRAFAAFAFILAPTLEPKWLRMMCF